MQSYFVSYNRADRDWAEWIAWVIEWCGYRAVIQAWDFLPGCVWPAEMQKAVRDCDATVCVLSPDFLMSDFTAAEWQVFFIIDPVGEKRKLIPVKVRECEPEGFLATRVYVDIVGRSPEYARDALRRALAGERAKPGAEPVFPGGASREPTFPAKRGRYVLILEGTFEEYTRDRVEAMTQHLRQLLSDGNLTIKETRPGSVIVILECTASAFGRVRELVRKEQVLEGADSPVVACWELKEGGSYGNPVDDRLAEHQRWLRKWFESHVDKETAKDLAQDVIVQILKSGELRYRVLGSRALLVLLARVALRRYTHSRSREAAARRKFARESNSEERLEELRLEALRTSMQVFGRLEEDDRELLEKYWDARFEGYELTETVSERTRAIEERLQESVSVELKAREEG
ncbi:MAG: toll/interleukin-1 receptor domain-containing protein [Propionibacteriaceae bacterium]|nr:toll/interleukin-1 receptor domain-containing protein [Propionibacteriaceae bacterium]